MWEIYTSNAIERLRRGGIFIACCAVWDKKGCAGVREALKELNANNITGRHAACKVARRHIPWLQKRYDENGRRRTS